MSSFIKYWRRWALAAAAIVVVAAVAFGRPVVERFLPDRQEAPTAADHAAVLSRAALAAVDDHAEDDHDHDHGDPDVIELSEQALKNIRFEPITLALGEYQRTVSMPGMVVERPGQTQLNIAAPLGGVVTRLYVITGEAVAEGAPLFDVRLTHEELVSAQGEYLKTLEELDVINREITRLEGIAEGVVAGGRVRDQKYRRQQLEASLRAQRQALLLHGLTEADIDNIVQTRTLLQSLTIRAPRHGDDVNCGEDHLYHVQSLQVQRGQQVEAGATVCVLADHCELFIEGTAFEQDAERLREAAAANVEISAHRVGQDEGPLVEALRILYIADQIDPESRALHFYVPLPNVVELDQMQNSRRFLQWKYRPGQRMELHVPVEQWQDRLVVPADAVVTEGAETYVYAQEEPGHFHRTPVHVEHRDKQTAVIASDGSIAPGAVIANRGAFQIHLALKNKSGGGVDPHAGHSH